MSTSTIYKNKPYNSKSSAAMAMLSDGYSPQQIAKELNITVQCVSATKNRIQKNIMKSIKKAKNLLQLPSKQQLT